MALDERLGLADETPDEESEYWDSPSEPMRVARRIIREKYMADDALTLCHHHGSWVGWDECWQPVEDRTVRSRLYDILEDAVWRHPRDGDTRWAPTRHKIANLMEALAAIVHMPDTVTAPAWIADGDGPAADELVIVANGILHVPTRKLVSHDPRLYSTVKVAFDYDPDAAEPTRWLRFLDELWGDDIAAKETLGEWFGYVLSGRNDLDKILLVVGPTRAGKRIIADTLGMLIGTEYCASPTFASLGQNFGLWPLIGKPLATVTDARLSGRSDLAIIAERLLSISGQDLQTIDRKYLEPWTGKLPTRFQVMSNELPRFGDSSGALANRFVVLMLTESFLGREDPELLNKLTPELPGILNWALDGLDRLHERRRFGPVESSVDAIRQLGDLASPVSAFVRDRCKLDPDLTVPVDDLYQAWRDWCEEAGMGRIPTKATFGRDLSAAYPSVKRTRPRDDDNRVYTYEGISLTQTYVGPDLGPLGPDDETAGSGPNGPGSKRTQLQISETP